MAVRVGFVGAGGRTVREMLDLVQIPDAEIAALCDIDVPRCQQAVERVRDRTGQGTNQEAIERAGAMNPAFFADVLRMLDGTDLDAVYVSLPPFVHGEIEHAIIDAGKALFVEKPVALTMAEAREIEQHIREKGVLSCVGYQSRYSTAVQAARERLTGVPIGLVVAIRMGGLPGTPWWRVQSRSGGMLIEQHTHGVDLMRYLAGDVQSVFAYANTVLLTDVPGLDIADVNSATVRFVNGAVGTIANTCALQPGQGSPPNVAGAVHIVAKNMTVMVSAGNATFMLPERRREEVPGEGDANLSMNQAFIRAVQTGERSGILSDYTDGMKTFEVTYACHLSAERGQEVRIGEGY
ncbi:MAG: Gfo/Idh/MocA family oxidoreductase [Chloroflexi bacterium]|nr:Gfo/Idh/MocA family oxidoreductase [Chloroflexota bacterium]